MSAIYTFAFENALLLPRACEAVRVIREDNYPFVPSVPAPAVTSRWSFEFGHDGNRSLVRHWMPAAGPGVEHAEEYRHSIA